MMNAQLNRIRDSISQALVERLEAQLTIFRDQIGREIDLLRRDFAALAERMENGPDAVPPVHSPAAIPSLAISAPHGRFQVAEEPGTPTETPIEPAPKMAEAVSDAGSSCDKDEYSGIDSPFQRPAPRLEERPLAQRPRSSFAPAARTAPYIPAAARTGSSTTGVSGVPFVASDRRPPRPNPTPRSARGLPSFPLP